MEGGKPRPRIISCHSFLVMTATIPPLCTTNLYRVYKSNTRFAMIGSRLIGVPVNVNNIMIQRQITNIDAYYSLQTIIIRNDIFNLNWSVIIVALISDNGSIGYRSQRIVNGCYKNVLKLFRHTQSKCQQILKFLSRQM